MKGFLSKLYFCCIMHISLKKSSAYLPILWTTPLYELTPIFKGKSWASSFNDFLKIWNSPINKGVHTMTPQSNTLWHHNPILIWLPP